VPDIFISYRREDTSGYAGRLYDQVSSHFGQDHVFMDVADLEPGSDFVDTIETKVSTCDALIALIGKNWLTIKDEQNQVRLTKPGDFVSVEIAAALKRSVEVIPVLVGGGKMPLERELPESLQSLCRRQALELSDVHFARDVGDLIEALKRPAGTRGARSPEWLKPTPIASISMVLALAAGIGIWTWRNAPHPPGQAIAPVVAGNPPTDPPANSSKNAHNANIGGNWRAVVQKEDVKYEIYFTFEVVGDKLFGKAVYPTGEAGILNGTIGQNKISFITKHVPDFADEEATITVEGKVSSDEIQVFTQDRDGYSKGVAHRVARISRAKVLTP
jgi:TIR domain-containing protein